MMLSLIPIFLFRISIGNTNNNTFEKFEKKETTNTLETIHIYSPYEKNFEKMEYSSKEIRARPSQTDAFLSNSLNKTSGFILRNSSGPGSSIQASSVGALYSGETILLIDGFPAIDSLGIGTNLSHYPSSLLESYTYETSPASRVGRNVPQIGTAASQVQLQYGLAQSAAPQKILKAQMEVGSANTTSLSSLFHNLRENGNLLLGIQFFNTNGRFPYKEPETGKILERQNNSSLNGAGILKKQWFYSDQKSFTLLDSFYLGSRVNPGSTMSPSRQQQRDYSNLFGMEWVSRPVSAKASMNHHRLTTAGPAYAFGDASERTNDFSSAYYAKLQYQSSAEGLPYSHSVNIEGHLNQLDKNEGYFQQKLGALSDSLSYRWNEHFLSEVALRYQWHSEFSNSSVWNSFDPSVQLQYDFNPKTGLHFSSGIASSYPAIWARSGFQSNAFTVVPNSMLAKRQDQFFNLHSFIQEKTWGLSTRFFLNKIYNQVDFQPLNDQQAIYVNTAQVRSYGTMLDFSLTLLSILHLHSAWTLSRTYNFEKKLDLPYKPRVKNWTSLGIAANRFTLTIEEEWLGKRYSDLSEKSLLDAIAQTHLKLEVKVFGGQGFAKINNLFQKSGYDSPGFPLIGRTFWVGYQFVEIQRDEK